MTQADGRIALLYRAVPVIFGLFLIANVATLFVLGRWGGSASGDRLEIVFSSTCADGSAAVIAERVEAMGLGDPEQTVQGDRIRLVATMPGHDDDRSAVPALLAREGHLQVEHGDSILATEADLTDVTVALDDAGMPFTQLFLKGEAAARLAQAVEADHDGTLRFVLDGELLAERPNTIKVLEDKIKVTAGEGDTVVRMRRAADRSIVLSHGPQPCPVSVASVTSVD